MKTFKLLTAGLAIITLLFTSCKKEEETQDETANLTLAKTSLTLKVGEYEKVAIKTGNGTYTATSSDITKATVTLVNNELTITALAEGLATVTVSDAKNRTADISVKVLDLVVPGEHITLLKGNTATRTISFGNDYKVATTDAAIATATIANNLLTIEAISKGNVLVTVKDLVSEKVQTFSVTVESQPLALSVATVALTKGEKVAVAIVSGNSSYTVSVADTAVAAATVSGTTVTVTGVGVGTTKITVKDADDKTAELSVIVNAFSLTLERNAVEVNADAAVEVAITAGNGNYTLQVADNSKATATIVGDKVRIEGKAAGTTKVTVKDSQNKTAEITVTVKPRGLSLERTALTINAGTTAEVAIFSGNGGYTVQVADNSKVTASVVNNKVRIEAKAAGTTKVTVKDSQNKTAEITVTVKGADLELAKANVEVNVGATAEVAIVKGTAPYTVSVINSSVATAQIIGGNKVRIEGKAAGTTKVTVGDDQAKQAFIMVTVKAASTDDLFDIVEGEDIEEEDYKNERVIEVKGSASAISGDIVLPARGTVLADNTLEYSSVSSVDFNNVKIIGEGALHSSRNLTKVLLRKVTKIKSMAFAECDKLKEVRCYMNVPPTVESDAFDGIAEDAVLWVPRGKKGAYEAVEAFSSSFSEIKEM
ncbi:bacterial group 2 Ig-like protein [Capnocytophaga sp. oral taxon 332 str. F0381]|uniref:pilus assembly protein N-terminal domain-containing protein n=1 Tax=Capnocytophaga sp. oral taxon 332 TaxID=712213 RepID=UPI0002A1B95C|nr:pilus assembly protein N-terminal domain-containing protein [Capnocytophaga sp. oral taxon 332]EKY08022.1 bacterial group 2 Ig-like protein [Capnocytophaga sp. oral taxon 332 str. F0381]